MTAGRSRDQVVVEPAPRAQPAAEDPAFDLGVGELEVDDAVDVVGLQEELGLAGVSGEAVDDEPVVPVVERQAVPHHRLDELVVDELAGGDDAPDVGAKLGVVLHVPAEDVADADVDEVVGLGEQLRLRALATALNAQDHKLAHRVSVSRIACAPGRAPADADGTHADEDEGTGGDRTPRLRPRAGRRERPAVAEREGGGLAAGAAPGSPVPPLGSTVVVVVVVVVVPTQSGSASSTSPSASLSTRVVADLGLGWISTRSSLAVVALGIPCAHIGCARSIGGHHE